MLPLFLSAFLLLQLLKFCCCAQPCSLLQRTRHRNCNYSCNSCTDICICICCYGLCISAEVTEKVVAMMAVMMTTAALYCCSCHSTHNIISPLKFYLRCFNYRISFIHVYIKQLRYLTFTQYIEVGLLPPLYNLLFNFTFNRKKPNNDFISLLFNCFHCSSCSRFSVW